MELNIIREMWARVSKVSTNPEVEKLLRATQLFELVSNPQEAYNYIDNLLSSINEDELKKESILMTIEGNDISLFDLLSSLRQDVIDKLINY